MVLCGESSREMEKCSPSLAIFGKWSGMWKAEENGEVPVGK
jgi:hypothetical protein